MNVFFSSFEYHMFYVLYPFVTYLLKLPRIYQRPLTLLYVKSSRSPSTESVETSVINLAFFSFTISLILVLFSFVFYSFFSLTSFILFFHYFISLALLFVSFYYSFFVSQFPCFVLSFSYAFQRLEECLFLIRASSLILDCPHPSSSYITGLVHTRCSQFSRHPV
jgi:hypothetical protein